MHFLRIFEENYIFEARASLHLYRVSQIVYDENDDDPKESVTRKECTLRVRARQFVSQEAS
jgi:hypothetical protein